MPARPHRRPRLLLAARHAPPDLSGQRRPVINLVLILGLDLVVDDLAPVVVVVRHRP